MIHTEVDELNEFLDDMGYPELDKKEQQNLMEGELDNEKSDD